MFEQTIAEEHPELDRGEVFELVQEILRVNPDFTAVHAAQLFARAPGPDQIKALRRAGLP